MFEQFTDKAKKVMLLANIQAHKYNYEFLTPECLFLGLLGEGYGIGVKILWKLGIDLQQAQFEIEKQMQTEPGILRANQPPPDPVTKRIIESAIAEARAVKHNDVGTEHLLLGLILAKDTVPAQLLEFFGVTAEKVRELLH